MRSNAGSGFENTALLQAESSQGLVRKQRALVKYTVLGAT